MQAQFSLNFETTSSTITSKPCFDTPLRARQSAFKSYMIQKYCAGDASSETVAEVFELLPELRGA